LSITDDQILHAGVCGLAELYRTGSVTPVEAVAYYYGRISAHNERLRAFIHLCQADAMAEAVTSTARWAAQRPLSPLDGVPIGVKANIAVAGLPFHAGIRAYADRIAAHDAACIGALRAKGAIVLGLLNMDEGAFGATGDNAWLGRAQNPYAEGYSPGGSSGGAGAAVSAGLCAAAIGTDTMGSVRIPAAFCGCFGYKPSRNLISREGVIPLSPRFDTVGVLARSVTDCAAIAASNAEPEEIVLGVPKDWDAIEMDGDLRRAIGELIDRTQSSGARIAPIDLGPYDFGKIRRHCLLIIEAEGMKAHPGLESDQAGFSDQFVKMLRWGAAQPPEKLAAAYRAVNEAADFIRSMLAGVTAMLLPTTPGPAFAFESGAPHNLGDFAAMANVTGLSAIALPVGLSQASLPLSIQCIGRNDGAALAAAGFLAGIAPACPPP
jgi:aspartyl-tRNA(Asn)/glutamyl-tRNA(Gln) amidotransferase subunit A